MNEVRYWIALIMICLIPGTFAYWFSIHPFIGFWRRFGAVRTVVVHLAGCAAIAAGMASQRQWLLSVEFGNHAVAAAAGAALLILSGAMRRKLLVQMRLRTLAGLPELEPAGRPQPLLKDGLYARIRHPRYVQLLIALWGWALLANYLGLYVLALLSLPAVRALVFYEERELSGRYGAEWLEYARRTPRFIPRRGIWGTGLGNG